ncbi:MAG TPA: SGNH/GDSL hydrolase family protein [Capsulimonadaceae bacterium]|jgi:lysophospholipase L1-like esterase
MHYATFAIVLLALLSVALAVQPDEANADTPDLTSNAQLVVPRQGLGNFFAKVHAGKPVTVAYFGGSITAANGWRVQTQQWLTKQYPQAKFTEVHAAIGGTGSNLGAFRCQHDVLQYKPDLIFVEFAVNDGGDAPESIWRQMEGIVRQIWRANPETDICYVYTFKVGYEDALKAGHNPRAAAADEKLADFYGIPSINVALETVNRAEAGKLIYVPKKDADGKVLPTPDGVTLFSNDSVHPLDAGHQIYTQVITDALKQMEPMPAVGKRTLKEPFIVGNWEQAKQVPLQPSMLSAGWKKLAADDAVGKYFFNRMSEIWQGDKPGETIMFKFKGTSARLYDLMGPDAGQAIVTVDNKPPFNVSRFDKYCTYHRLATLVFGEGMPDTVHTVKIEISPVQPDRTPASSGEKGTFDPKKYDGTVIRTGAILLIGDIVD